MMKDGMLYNDLRSRALDLTRDDAADPLIWLGHVRVWIGEAKALLDREVLADIQNEKLSELVSQIEARREEVLKKVAQVA